MNPYALIAAVVFTACLLGGTFYGGVEYEKGQHAIAHQDAINDAIEKARADAAVESAIALAESKAAEASRASARDRQHKLEMELAKDENARTCRVGDGTFRLLSAAIDSTDRSRGAGSGHVGVQPATATGGANGSGFGSLGARIGGGLYNLSKPAARVEGVD